MAAAAAAAGFLGEVVPDTIAGRGHGMSDVSKSSSNLHSTSAAKAAEGAAAATGASHRNGDAAAGADPAAVAIRSTSEGGAVAHAKPWTGRPAEMVSNRQS